MKLRNARRSHCLLLLGRLMMLKSLSSLVERLLWRLTIERLMDRRYVVIENVAKKVSSLRNELTHFIKNLSKHQRDAASHIFVLMISSECRNRKPYALPVQCLLVKDKEVRPIL